MTTAAPSKTRSVMTLTQATSSGYALFEGFDDIRHHTLSLAYDAWDDMGRPGEITVTFEPGNMVDVEENWVATRARTDERFKL